MAPFGQTIPVTGPYIGFPGKISRLGERVVAARQVLSTTPNPIPFGAPVVLVGDASGGTWQSVADFIAGGGTFAAANFAGVAIAEVDSALTYPATPGQQTLGSYAPALMAEVLERGSVTVQLNVTGSPVAGGPVYVRKTANGAIPAGIVGGFEGAADGANNIQLTGVVFRTGAVDSNGMAEITLLNRVAA